MKPLFTEPVLYPISKKKAPNRMVLAPMTNQQSYADGTASDEEIRFLSMRAKGGFGTVVTCAMYVQQDGKAWQGQMGISDDAHIAGLQKLTDSIRTHGSLSIAQLFHAGSRADASLNGGRVWSASDIFHPAKGHQIAVEGREEDIHGVIQAFERAAIRAAEAGFDGVEIHAAHGYLIHQFLSATTNRRNDQWGGDAKKRRRFLKEILKAVQKHLKGQLIVGVRISPEDFSFFSGIDFDESLETAQQLYASEVDYVDISLWDALKRPSKYPDGPQAISFFSQLKGSSPTLLRTAGTIWTRDQGEQVLSLGADLLAIGRAAIAHHDLPKRWAGNLTLHYPPYSTEYLMKEGLSMPFVRYMKRWPNFVKEEIALNEQ